MSRRNPIPFSLRMQEPEIEFENNDPPIHPGVYPAYCRWAGKYYDRQYQRWTCLLLFDVFSENLQQIIAKRVPLWFRLGDGEKPRISRRGKYLAAWVEANGGRPPSKSDRIDRLSPKVFSGRVAQIEIENAKSPVPYSIVRKIIRWETGEKTAPAPYLVIR